MPNSDLDSDLDPNEREERRARRSQEQASEEILQTNLRACNDRISFLECELESSIGKEADKAQAQYILSRKQELQAIKGDPRKLERRHELEFDLRDYRTDIEKLQRNMKQFKRWKKRGSEAEEWSKNRLTSSIAKEKAEMARDKEEFDRLSHELEHKPLQPNRQIEYESDSKSTSKSSQAKVPRARRIEPVLTVPDSAPERRIERWNEQVISSTRYSSGFGAGPGTIRGRSGALDSTRSGSRTPTVSSSYTASVGMRMRDGSESAYSTGTLVLPSRDSHSQTTSILRSSVPASMISTSSSRPAERAPARPGKGQRSTGRLHTVPHPQQESRHAPPVHTVSTPLVRQNASNGGSSLTASRTGHGNKQRRASQKRAREHNKR